MQKIDNVDAREFGQKKRPDEYEVLRRVIAPEIQATKVARLMESSMIEFAPGIRKLVASVLAAELYPDGEEPKLLVAQDESETHEALRATCPSSEPRVSAEYYTLVNLKEIAFLSLDPVVLDAGATGLPTEKQLPEVADWLYGRNIVPVDAEYRIIIIR